MRVIEQFTEGKTGDESRNEDGIVVTPGFIAVIDGATTGGGFRPGGMSPGRFAALTVAEEVARLPPDIEGPAAFARISAALAAKTRAAATGPVAPFAMPAAALLVYSRARREIWRIADPVFMVDGVTHARQLAHEAALAELRRVMLHAELARGGSDKDWLEKDPSGETVGMLWSKIEGFANHEDPLYGYGVINGADALKQVEIFPVPRAKDIVFATDGYPEVFGTLQETEAALQKTLAADPLMYRLHPQTQGVAKGNKSYDDRTYVRFEV